MHDTMIQGFQISPQQQRLWSLIHQNQQFSCVAQSAVRIDGPLDQARLRQSLQQLVERHEILRMQFRLLPGMPTPLQVLSAAQLVWDDPRDLSDLGAAAPAAFDQLFVQLRQQPIDSERGPILHASLVKIAPGQHRLLIRLPALAADSYTLTQITAQLAQTYAEGRESGAEDEEAIQYVVVSDWLNELIESAEAEPGRKFWRQQAWEEVLPAPLPFQQRPGPAAGPPTTLRQIWDSVDIARLQAAVAGLEATLETFLLTAWQTLIWRLTAAKNLLIGVAFDGHTDEELDQTLGPFARYLPISAALQPDASFAGMLRQTAQTLEAAAAWQECFAWSGAQRGAFFAYGFGFHDQSATYPAAGATFGTDRQAVANDQFQIRLACAHTAAGLELCFEYDSALYAQPEIERLARQLRTLVDAAAAQPTALIRLLEVVDQAERQLLETFNPTRTFPALEQCLPALFEAQAAQSPEHPALRLGQHELTYRELNERANQLAHQLQRSGVRPETFVAVYLDRSVEMIVALLAVLKAGGVYAPLDPAAPQERLRLILEQTQPQVIVSQSPLAAKLPPHHAEVVLLDPLGAAPSAPSENPAPGISGHNLAYVIFTSGSTGVPKGVQISHDSFARHCLAAREAYALTPQDRVLQFSVLHFDAALEQILPPLLSGATVVLRGNQVWDAAHCAGVIVEEQLSVINLPTAYWHQVTHAWAGSGAPASHCLRLVIVGGEAIQPDSVRLWEGMFGQTVRLLNAYGPTEATITASTYAVLEATADRSFDKGVPIGRPLGQRTVYILDHYGNPVPVGVVGELCLGGANLARGYLNDPALTAARFIPDQWSDDPGARLYRSGDLASYGADGTLVFSGRVDHQVKLRGFRIELAEIELALRKHPAVREAIVLARESAEIAGDKRLIAYLVAMAGQDLAPTELREFLAQSLPDYMLPGDIVVLEALPITSNGKVDRAALPNPEEIAAFPQHTYVAPRTLIEEAVQEIWCDVFGLGQIGIHTDFFNLGGHSLIATQVVARVRAVFQADISLRSLLNNPTIAGLAGIIEQVLREEWQLSTPPLAPVARDRDHWLSSFAQQRLWFLQNLDPASPAYNMPGSLRINGALDRGALERSLAEIIRRHDSLRTTFTLAAGQPAQVVAPFTGWALPLEDLRQLPAEQRTLAAADLATADAQRTFDLQHGPLLRVTLLQLADNEHILLLNLHHIIADAWSVKVLLRELAQLYEAFTSAKPSPLPELSLQYLDFAAWQSGWLQGATLEAQLAYWRTQLGGPGDPGVGGSAPPLLALPTDRPRPPVQTFSGASRPFTLAPELLNGLKDLSRQQETTLFMTLLGAFQVVLAHYSGQHDIVVGSPVAGRSHAELEPLIGCFINTLALRTNLAGDPTFRALLAQVRETTLGAYAHQDVPFEKLVEELQPERNLGHSPLFQVMFTLQHHPSSELALKDLELEISPVENNTTKFDLTLHVLVEATLHGSLEYNTDLFDAATMDRMLQHWTTLLEHLVAGGIDQPISRLALLDAAERQRLLSWNATAAAYPATRCLHELFAEQATRTPDASAVVAGEASLTYRTLDQRANQLAHQLQAEGVGPDTLVGIALERSIELVVALLAVLKAGGAYLPLDATYPAERLTAIVSDARPRVVLTQAAPDRDLAAAGGARVLTLSDPALQAALAEMPTTPPTSAVTPANMIYVIYTSGSTGQPKGVINTHTGVVNRLTWMQQRYPLAASDRMLQKTPFTFDVSVWEFFWPLLAGAQLVLARPGGHQDPAYLIETIAHAQISAVHFVPSMLQVFLETLGAGRALPLRQIFCSGEALSGSVRDQCFANLPEVALRNLYGPTEAAIEATAWDCSGAETQASVPIGRPIANVTTYVLNQHQELAPIGVPGELYLGGVGVARGYLNLPGLTAERFVPDPYAASPGARLYRTGDLARWRSDGVLEFLGRLDHQVKLRGFRIEPGEIETVLEQHPAVGQAIVALREDTPGDAYLAAYVVPAADAASAGASPLSADLQAYLRTRLPEYMVPAAFVTLAALPLTSSGKLDRAALPAARLDRTTLAVDYVAPRSVAEERLALIWAEVLDLEQVGVYDNFFDLGGHSLKAVQVVSRVRDVFGLELPLNTIFHAPAIADFVQELERAERGQTLPPIAALPRQARRAQAAPAAAAPEAETEIASG